MCLSLKFKPRVLGLLLLTFRNLNGLWNFFIYLSFFFLIGGSIISTTKGGPEEIRRAGFEGIHFSGTRGGGGGGDGVAFGRRRRS